jgi:hypothetical protein
LELRGRESQESGENSTMRNFICTIYQIIRMIKSRRMRWLRHVAQIWTMKNCLVGKAEGKRLFRRVGVDGRIIEKVILNKCCVRAWAGLIRLRIGFADGVL